MLLLIKVLYPVTELSSLLLDQVALVAQAGVVQQVPGVSWVLRFLLVVVALVANRTGHLLLALLGLVLVAVVHLAGLRGQLPVVVTLQYLAMVLVGANQEVDGVVTPPEVVLTEVEQ
tara:strand:+ start:982 stop:1332 length:351 start_codon:yes stop_codon:yes gene_type:complete